MQSSQEGPAAFVAEEKAGSPEQPMEVSGPGDIGVIQVNHSAESSCDPQSSTDIGEVPLNVPDQDSGAMDMDTVPQSTDSKHSFLSLGDVLRISKLLWARSVLMYQHIQNGTWRLLSSIIGCDSDGGEWKDPGPSRPYVARYGILFEATRGPAMVYM